MSADRNAAPLPAALTLMLQAWLAGGLLLLALQPPQQWHNHYIGSLPYWLVVAPVLCLSLLHRDRLAAALSAFLVRGRRRRNLSRPLRGAAARRRRPAARPAYRALRAAMIGG
jgi:hypothetical protein